MSKLFSYLLWRKSFRRKIDNVMIIKFKDSEYIFFYHNSDNAWISKDLIHLKSKNSLFKFHIEIPLKEFKNKEFDETLISDFLSFLEKNLHDELDPIAQKILIPFNEIIDTEFLNQKEKFRFEFDTIHYKEPGRSFNTLYNKIGFNYSLCYQLYHTDFEESYAPNTFYFIDFLNTSLIGCHVDLPY